MPIIPDFATNNAHMFYIRCKNVEQRNGLLKYLNSEGINAVFHYISLHSSPFYSQKHDGRKLLQTDAFTDTLIRLPLYYDLNEVDQEIVISKTLEFKG
jgi:dTDP-4-amino-4,6-dideoxygalactose transaminase